MAVHRVLSADLTWVWREWPSAGERHPGEPVEQSYERIGQEPPGPCSRRCGGGGIRRPGLDGLACERKGEPSLARSSGPTEDFELASVAHRLAALTVIRQ